MTFSGLRDRLAQHHRTAKQERELYRAVAHAPTESSRQEILGLQRGYNNL